MDTNTTYLIITDAILFGGLIWLRWECHRNACNLARLERQTFIALRVVGDNIGIIHDVLDANNHDGPLQ